MRHVPLEALSKRAVSTAGREPRCSKSTAVRLLPTPAICFLAAIGSRDENQRLRQPVCLHPLGIETSGCQQSLFGLYNRGDRFQGALGNDEAWCGEYRRKQPPSVTIE